MRLKGPGWLQCPARLASDSVWEGEEKQQQGWMLSLSGNHTAATNMQPALIAPHTHSTPFSITLPPRSTLALR